MRVMGKGFIIKCKSDINGIHMCIIGNKIEINPQKLYSGCIFMAVAHAVTVGEYPELNYEHYWDGINYFIAVFQDMSAEMPYQDAMNYFKGAPEAIVELAKTEAFQYVLENIAGEIKPYITAAFWGTWDELYSTSEYGEFMKNSAHILDIQLMEIHEALKACDDYYGLTDEQMDLILFLSKQRTQTDFAMPVILKKANALYGDMDEIRASMNELNIKLEE